MGSTVQPPEESVQITAIHSSSLGGVVTGRITVAGTLKVSPAGLNV